MPPVFDSRSDWKDDLAPVPGAAGAEAKSGRGLQVAAGPSAGRWRHRLTRSRFSGWKVPGKTVWFALPVAGRPLYAAVLAQEVPSSPLGAAWRFADRLREYRGDSHTAAWTAAGFDAVEIGLMTELYWGLPLKTYTRSRAWSKDELDDGIERLEDRGFIKAGAFTARGREEREAIEQCTDRQCRPIIECLGDEFETVINVLTPLGREIRNKHGYPASGPHDIARTAASQN